MPHQRSNGFTLIELMIVVAIIALLAAISIPSMLRSRMAANETSAVASIKAYSQAQEIFRRTDWDVNGMLEYSQSLGNVNYPGVIYPNLIDKAANDGIVAVIDRALANAEGEPGLATGKAGYVFAILKTHGPTQRSFVVSIAGGAPAMLYGHALSGVPESYDATGRNRYLLDQSGVIYQLDMGVQANQETNYDPLDTTNGKWVVNAQ
jgi:prepilin-type N-terminal cleavage/methylation domain-containing protein